MITLSNILGRGYTDEVKQLLPANVIQIFIPTIDDDNQKYTTSKILSGTIGEKTYCRDCANFLCNTQNFETYYQYILEYWKNQENSTSIKGDEEEKKFPKKIKFWIKIARDNNQLTPEVLRTIYTIFAITHGNWSDNLADKMYACLPKVELFFFTTFNGFQDVLKPQEDKDALNFLENQFPQYQALRNCLAQIKNRNIDASNHYLSDALSEGKNLWNAFVYQSVFDVYRTYTLIAEASIACQRIGFLHKCRNYLTAALNEETNVERHYSIQNWRINATQTMLEESVSLLKKNPMLFERLTEYLAPNNADNKTPKELAIYGKNYFELVTKVFSSEKFQSNRLRCLKFGEQINNPKCMQILMELYLKDENEEAQQYEGWALAERLSKNTADPTICGDACWRLYKKTKNRDYLKNAFRCGTPAEAVREYTNDKILYSNYLEPANFQHAGICLFNIEKNNPVAQIFEATKPETWTSYFLDNRNEIDKFVDHDKSLICIFAKNSAEDNLKDFLYLLERFKEKSPAYAMLFISADEDNLVNLIDTAINRFYNFFENKNEPLPLIRVQIVQESKLAAQNVLARVPLFYPLWKNPYVNEPIKFVIVGNGATVPWLEKESRWLMTDIPFAEITKIDSLKNVADLEKVEKVIAKNQLLYFAVDTGNGDLENFTTATKIRQLLIRHWAKKAEGMPIDTPIVFFSNDLDISFLSLYSTFCGQYGEAWYNSPNVVAFGGGDIWTWDHLISDVIERISVCVHLSYFGNDYEAGYQNYSRWIYNHDSSRSVALSIPYRCYKMNAQMFPADWSWSDTNLLFHMNSRRKFAEYFTNANAELINELAKYESNRWCNFMQTRGWQNVSISVAKKYMDLLPSKSHQLFIAKLHPAITEFEKLDNLHKNLGKDFKDTNIENIKQTANFLQETFFNENNEVADRIKLLFGME